MNNKTAIVVDNEDALRLLAHDQLGDLGYTVEEAENGHTACKMIASKRDSGKPFDLILTDFNMPVLNGLGLIHQLRDEQDWTPIIIASGEMDSLDKSKFTVYRAYPLRKPYSEKELAQAIIEASVLVEQPQLEVAH